MGMLVEVENHEKKRGRPRLHPVTSSHYKVDTKGTCLLCFRECGSRKFRGQSSLLEAKRKEKDLSILFCKLLMRHLKVKFQRNIAQPSKLKLKEKIKTVAIELCEDCSLMASNFCEMYHKLEVLKIRLHGYLQTLSKIMRSAGRIPSRMRAYHDKMGVESQIPKGAKSQSGNPTSALVTPRPSAFVMKKRRIAVKLAENFRKELIRKLTQKSRDISPRVRLTKVNPSDQSLSTVTTIAIPERTSSLVAVRPLPSWNLQRMIFAYYASVISFPLVLWLATYNDSNGGKLPSKLGAGAPPNHGGSISVEEPVNPPPEEIRPHSITITDSGKTVMLPHQNFKMAGEAFVDESMDCECSGDLINLEDDAFLGPSNPVTVEISADIIDIDNHDDHNEDELAAAAGTINSQLQLIEEEILEMEMEPEPIMMEEESTLNLNDKTCTECQIELSCRAEVEKHRALIHKTSCYVQCPACKKMLASYQALKAHRLESESCEIDEASEHDELEYIAKPLFPHVTTIRGNNFCPLEGCFEVFFKSENLQLHLKTHGQWACEFCPEKFEKGHDLALHECTEHSGNDVSNGYKCTRCNVHVVAQHNFIVHFLETHLKLDVFADRCKVCQRGFLSSQKILKDVHFKTHHDVEGKPPQSIFKCDLCEAPFLKKNQLNEHKMHVHNLGQPKERLHRCTVCDLELISQRVLLRHKLTEHTNLEKHEIQAQLKSKLPNRRKHECHCGLTFTTKFSLLSHSRIHEQLDKDIAKHQKEYEEQQQKQRLLAEQEKAGDNLETSSKGKE